MVLAACDPTMHAEIAAIRATETWRFRLNGVPSTTCEPCPVFGGISAKIPEVYFGANRKDAENAGFDDNYIYEYIKGTAPEKKITVRGLDREECLELFDRWLKKKNKIIY